MISNVTHCHLSRTREGDHRLGLLFTFYSPDLMQAGAFHVVWYAMTADVVLSDVFGSDTRGQLPQVKSRYIFRSEKKGNCLGSVGRWGLLRQQWGALFAPHTPETLINRAFLIPRPWNFCEKRPKLPLVEMTIRGPERKNGLSCHSTMGDCLPF